MVDRNIMDQMTELLRSMDIPVRVIDHDPETVLSDPDDLIIRTSNLLREDVPVTVLGRMCLRVNYPDVILICDRNVHGAKEILKLSASLIAQIQRAPLEESAPDAFKQILLGNMNSDDVENLCSRLRLSRMKERRVMIFHILQPDISRTFATLSDIAPLEDGDFMVDLDRNTAVMIRDIQSGETLDDALQYARALHETVLSETGKTVTVGIGNVVEDLADLTESYREARRAIEVGRTFAPENYIYAYSQLLLERFLMALPEQTAGGYLRVLFNEKTQRILNEEMLFTIETFFKKDLNLSDTARQLYIHRNTLVYRLEKLYRHTGLDLRKFEDAVTFKVFLELKKSRRLEDSTKN
ncbi:MAG: helix-turn-helix domain-containing protein [Firmicutes bacterium]|nr:helix-turn-helix domain-containing protein [Bacillota bacterium]